MSVYDDGVFDFHGHGHGPSPAGSSESPANIGTATTPAPGGGGKGRSRDNKEKETFACGFPGCGQSYSRMEYLKRHQRKHQDVRPFNCKDCGKAFARSDVLLRHRRRCHPTPPPDQNHSPPTTGRTRSYPGVPVSSSRNDSRELSPGGGSGAMGPPGIDGQYDHSSSSSSRKHPREESGSSFYLNDQDRVIRPRIGVSDDEEEDAFGLKQTMAGHLFGAGGNGDHQYYSTQASGGTSGDQSASYTPHLLPMFHSTQHPPQTNGNNERGGGGRGQGVSDPHHLEDASVLLSMAYPGGMNGNQSRGEQQGSGDDAGGDQHWAGQMSSGDLMGDSAGPLQDPISKEVLNDAMGNLFQNMSWMNDGVHNAVGPSEEQVKGVSDWMSGDMPLIDPALTGGATGLDNIGVNVHGNNNNNNGHSHSGSSNVSPDAQQGPSATRASISSSSASGTGSNPNSANSNTMSPFPMASLFSPSLFNGLSIPEMSGGVNSTSTSNPNPSSNNSNNNGMGIGMGSGVFGFDSADAAVNASGAQSGMGMGFEGVFGSSIFDQILAGAGLQSGSGLGQNNDQQNQGQNQNQNQQGQGQGQNQAFNSNGNSNSNFANMSLLEQIAMYEVPQTRINPNPERPILRIDSSMVAQRQGPQLLAFDARFYLDPSRFSGCYQIPHWKMPPIRTLSLMASRTFDTVLNHFSFVHGPTFKLTDAAACLAFAICTIGGIRNVKQKTDKLLDFFDTNNLNQGEEMDGPVLPEDTWEGMYRANYSAGSNNAAKGFGGSGRKHGAAAGGGTQSDFVARHTANNQPGPWTKDEMREAEDKRLVEEWDAGHTVRNEKTNMLVKSFSLAKGVLMTEYNVALLQALILYHAPYFLSEDDGERACANMFLGTIVNITRQIGFLTQELEHFESNIALPASPRPSPSELNNYWRRWIQLETRRRVAYLVYHLDTISSLESNIPCILSSCELSHMPMPAPDSVWKAPTAEKWLAAVRKYKPMTLDEAMRRIFFLPSFGAFDALHEKAGGKEGYNLLNEYEYGPFARSAMVLTLLRGVMDIGEGKRDRGDWRDLTDLWISCSWLRPGQTILDADGKDVGQVSRESLRDRFALGLERWRQGWDFDGLCQGRGTGRKAGSGFSTAAASPETTTTSASGVGAGAEGGQAAKLTYCEEALPFYWLAQALLGILSNAPPCAMGTNQLRGVRYGEMLKSARRFTRTGEGVASATDGQSCTNVPTGSGGSGPGSTSAPPFGSTSAGTGSVTVETPFAFPLTPDSAVDFSALMAGFSNPPSGAPTGSARGLELTPPTIAGFGNLPVGVGIGVGAGMGGGNGGMGMNMEMDMGMDLGFGMGSSSSNNAGGAGTGSGSGSGSGSGLTPPSAGTGLNYDFASWS